jgi:hypothetical protein
MAAYPDPTLPQPRRFPAGAIWLIALGVVFLIGNTGIFHIFHTHLFGPFLLIGVGVWIFVRKMTGDGFSMENDGTPEYRWRFMRAVTAAFWVILTGFIWLLHGLGILSWSRSWPMYLIGLGVLLLFKRSMEGGYSHYSGPPYTPPPASPAPITALVPSQPLQEGTIEPSPDQEGR